MLVNCAAKGLLLRSFSTRRFASSDAKVVIIGAGQYILIEAMHFHCNVVFAGAGGLTAANQLHKSLKRSGKTLSKEDIVIVDPAEYHYYQPGW
jgi:sulfide:quinone oxidoreductase